MQFMNQNNTNMKQKVIFFIGKLYTYPMGLEPTSPSTYNSLGEEVLVEHMKKKVVFIL